MDAKPETSGQNGNPAAPSGGDAGGATATRAAGPAPVLTPWLHAQAINVNRHAAALRPFRRDEFGNDAAAPTEGHIRAVNDLMDSLRAGLLRLTKRVSETSRAAAREPTTARLQRVVRLKERAHDRVRATERI